MRLGWLLFRQRQLPKGSIWRGKYRLVKRTTPLELDKLRMDLNRERSNMQFLRFPYLSKEESCGHSRAFRELEGKKSIFQEINYLRKSKPDVTFEDRLSHLLVADKWE